MSQTYYILTVPLEKNFLPTLEAFNEVAQSCFEAKLASYSYLGHKEVNFRSIEEILEFRDDEDNYLNEVRRLLPVSKFHRAFWREFDRKKDIFYVSAKNNPVDSIIYDVNHMDWILEYEEELSEKFFFAGSNNECDSFHPGYGSYPINHWPIPAQNASQRLELLRKINQYCNYIVLENVGGFSMTWGLHTFEPVYNWVTEVNPLTVGKEVGKSEFQVSSHQQWQRFSCYTVNSVGKYRFDIEKLRQNASLLELRQVLRTVLGCEVETQIYHSEAGDYLRDPQNHSVLRF